jgi:hypothetical protein
MDGMLTERITLDLDEDVLEVASKQVTDTHLLAQAVRHDAILVTLDRRDRRLSSVAVRNGEHHLLKLFEHFVT